jgi:hypothetical protein
MVCATGCLASKKHLIHQIQANQLELSNIMMIIIITSALYWIRKLSLSFNQHEKFELKL